MRPVCLALLALLLTTPASAQEPEGPVTGIFAAGACEEPGTVFFLEADWVLVLDTAPNGPTMMFGPLVWAAGTAMLSREGDVVVLPDVRAMTKCNAPPDHLYQPFGDAVRFLERWNALEATCHAGSESECWEAAVALVDLSGDKKLAQAEIGRVLRSAAHLVGYELTVSNDRIRGTGDSLLRNLRLGVTDINDAAASASLFGPIVSSAFLSWYDYDGDGFVSEAEVLQDFSRNELVGMIRKPEGGSLRNAIIRLTEFMTTVAGDAR